MEREVWYLINRLFSWWRSRKDMVEGDAMPVEKVFFDDKEVDLRYRKRG
jgi:hypothetical protein